MKRPLLARVLAAPARARSLEPSQWALLLRQAWAADLLASLGAALEEAGVGEAAPAAARPQLEAATRLAAAHERSVRWELHCLRRVLGPLELPVVLLKGAAYLAAALPPARGRVFHDVDVMVPKKALATVERALLLAGWASARPDPYDQRYYRRWMHELPPLRHIRRKTELDVHHTILPETARLRPRPEALFAAARPLPDGFRVLCPEDMVLHGAAHLFADGELEHGLRDLYDLHRLLGHFGREAGFWERLLERAGTLDLGRPLFYALRYAQRLLETPVPAEAAAEAARWAPPRARRRLMDALFRRGLAPLHPSCQDALTGGARWALYVRSHYLRMPLPLLLPHLARKAVKRRLEGRHAAGPGA